VLVAEADDGEAEVELDLGLQRGGWLGGRGRSRGQDEDDRDPVRHRPTV
jgi:hypothetical protein